MKTTIKAILMAFAFSSCNADLKTETVDNEISQTIIGDSEVQSSRFSETTGESESTFQHDSSLVGKTTVEIEKLGFISCAGSLIESNESENSYAVSQYGISKEECRNGKGKILLERFISRNGNMPVYEITDEINIQSSFPEKAYSWTTCKIKEADGEEFYVIHFKDKRQAELTEIYDLWAIDLKDGKFVKLKTADGVTCVNPDYYDDL